MKKKIFFGVIFILIAVGAVLPRQGFAFYLLGDKLRVKGSLYEFIIYGTNFKKGTNEYRDTNLGLVRTKATLELLYKAIDCPENSLNFFGFYRYWYEATPDIDKRYRETISPYLRRRFQKCNYYPDDWINEMYADWYHGPWNIRLGKQIVFWSEVELIRTVDQINQLDLRYSSPGIDPWDEMKLGLWMLRGFYNSQLPGQLIFEFMWIPDFRPVRTPTEGTFWGGNPGPPTPNEPPYYGQNAAIETEWIKSKPKNSLQNSAFAARIRGNSEVRIFKTPYLLDWTLSYYHGMNNTPVARRKYLGVPSTTNTDPNTLNGYGNRLANQRLAGDPYTDLPSHRFWNYKFYHIIGGSLQTFVPKLKGVVRGEVAYEINKPESTADAFENAPSYAKQITGSCTRNTVNAGLTYDVPIPVELLRHPKMQWLGANGTLDTSFGYFGQWRLGDVKNVRTTFGYQQKVQTGFTISSRTGLRNNALTPVVRTLWNTRKWGYTAFALAYTPGAHMRYELGYLMFYAKNVWDSREAQSEGKDNVYLKMGYEF
ncbi:MAG: DUF1302 family protein [Proteobacteria bacterium]|nr:DUF1302 family protein [Pseudomonadota bacterium]